MTRGLQHLGSCFEGMKSKLFSGLTVEKGCCFHWKWELNIVEAEGLNSALGNGISFWGLARHFRRFQWLNVLHHCVSKFWEPGLSGKALGRKWGRKMLEYFLLFLLMLSVCRILSAFLDLWQCSARERNWDELLSHKCFIVFVMVPIWKQVMGFSRKRLGWRVPSHQGINFTHITRS